MSDSSASSIPTRRRFLGWSGICLATAAAGVAGWRYAQHLGKLPASFAEAPLADLAPLASVVTTGSEGALSAEVFIPHLQTEFQAVAKGAPPRFLRLVGVTPGAPIQSPKVTYTSFSLLFEVAVSSEEGEVYHLDHPQLGGFDLFLSPVGDPKKKAFLEAIITQRAA